MSVILIVTNDASCCVEQGLRHARGSKRRREWATAPREQGDFALDDGALRDLGDRKCEARSKRQLQQLRAVGAAWWLRV
jgi:hypothetical protein